MLCVKWNYFCVYCCTFCSTQVDAPTSDWEAESSLPGGPTVTFCAAGAGVAPDGGGWESSDESAPERSWAPTSS
jgi:hypothetical protein